MYPIPTETVEKVIFTAWVKKTKPQPPAERVKYAMELELRSVSKSGYIAAMAYHGDTKGVNKELRQLKKQCEQRIISYMFDEQVLGGLRATGGHYLVSADILKLCLPKRHAMLEGR